MPSMSVRPVHALKPKKTPWHTSETLCGVDPMRPGVRAHRPKAESSP